MQHAAWQIVGQVTWLSLLNLEDYWEIDVTVPSCSTSQPKGKIWSRTYLSG